MELSNMTKTSTWTALRNPVFRRLWVASVISSTWVAAHDTAATWTMNTLTPSPFFLSLMSTVASTPFFLFTLPAGALADTVDRKKLLCLTNLWLAIGAGGLAMLGWMHLLNPYTVLSCVFLVGAGFAFNAPAWSSIVPQIVLDTELPSAVTLGGLQLNIAGIVGPVLGGALVPLIGANLVFAVNAACFLVVIRAVLGWKKTTVQSRVPLESFFESFVTAIRYVRYATGLQVVLARNALFALIISAIPALMPVVGLKVLYLSPSSLGLLLTSMSTGSVIAAVVIIPWLRSRFCPNTVTVLAKLLVLLVYVLMGIVRQTEPFFLFAALAGVGWTVSASELWVATQRAIPGWARGRMNATVIMVSQGAMAFGGVIWGYLATTAGVQNTLAGAAVVLLIGLVLAYPLSINFTEALNFDPGPVKDLSHKFISTLQRDRGPLSITMEFKIDSMRRREFVNLMREVRLIHLRNGAQRWGLHEDLACPNTFRLEMVVPSWNDHLLQLERMTKAEEEVLKKAWSLHLGTSPPEERSYISMSKELRTLRSCYFHPSTLPTSPLYLVASRGPPGQVRQSDLVLTRAGAIEPPCSNPHLGSPQE
jgi:MFS family permease